MLDPNAFIAGLNGQPPELVWLLTLLFCFGAILVMLKVFGEAGLYVYVAVAIIGANLQVLKVVEFSAFELIVADARLPLGTILFSSTYLCTDILAEHYGRGKARRAVWFGFAALLLFNGLMLLTLGFRPLTPGEAGSDWAWAVPNHGHMAALFTPGPAFFAAGMIAYLTSQYHDIWLFSLISRLTKRRYLWLRNNASTWLSALIDNTIFSVLAWVVFRADPVAWSAVISIILGTYALRVVVAALDTPFVYLARRCVGVRAGAYA